MPSVDSLATWCLVLGWLPMLFGVRRAGFAARDRSPGRGESPERSTRGFGLPGRRWVLLDVTLLLLTWLAGAALTFIAVHGVRLAPPSGRTWAGATLFVAAIATWTWIRRAYPADYSQLPRVPATLVTWGPYRVVRHPLYLATGWAGLGQCVAGASVPCLGLWLLLVASLVVRAAREEKLLAAAFGGRWEDYTRIVPAVFPTRRRR